MLLISVNGVNITSFLVRETTTTEFHDRLHVNIRFVMLNTCVAFGDVDLADQSECKTIQGQMS